ncbi:GNAT family N-acetyltransferase [Chitinophaga sp. 212800010-3]|uniref:GNAT family N-acetyltransferase n=1 Tax=unclassified Chitinophaga TaxID=2619133 RepID=UPI002E0E98FE
MSQDKITTRDARNSDIDAMALLMTELGYPTAAPAMAARFEAIKQEPGYKTILAVLNEEVVGMAGCTVNNFFEQDGKYVRIAAFVVSNRYHQKGIGRVLITAAEEWATNVNAHTVLLNCGHKEERTAAHVFYKKMGYQVKSSGYYKKILL